MKNTILILSILKKKKSIHQYYALRNKNYFTSQCRKSQEFGFEKHPNYFYLIARNQLNLKL